MRLQTTTVMVMICQNIYNTFQRIYHNILINTKCHVTIHCMKSGGWGNSA